MVFTATMGVHHNWAIAPQYMEQFETALFSFNASTPNNQCDLPSMASAARAVRPHTTNNHNATWWCDMAATAHSICIGALSNAAGEVQRTLRQYDWVSLCAEDGG